MKMTPLFFRSFRPVAASVLAVMALVALLANPANAQTGGIYTAPPVPIEATSDSVTKAKQAAIDAGQPKALRALLESLTKTADHGRLPQVTAAQADQMVVDFSLANERTAPNKYMANLTVRFNAAQVDQILSGLSVGHARPRTEPVLVLPVYMPAKDSPSAMLWEDTNPWAKAWGKSVGLKGGLVPIVLALGDIEDVSLLNASIAAQSVSGAANALPAALQIALRNGAPDVLIVLAQGTPQTGLTITTQGGGVFRTLKPITLPSRGDAFEQAVAQVRAALDDSWKTQGLPESPVSGSPLSNVPLTDGLVPPVPMSLENTPPCQPASAYPGWDAGPQAADPACAQQNPSSQGTTPDAFDDFPNMGAWNNRPIVILARYQTVDQWMDIQRRLQGLPGVTGLNIQAITRDQAQLALTYRGDAPALQATLSSRGLALTQRDGLWVLEVTSAVPPTPAAPDLPPVGGSFPVVK